MSVELSYKQNPNECGAWSG